MILGPYPKEIESRLTKRVLFYNTYNYGRFGVCMQRTGCRIGAIVGIVIGSILLLWLILFLISLATGGKLANAVCCGLRKRNRSAARNIDQQPYQNTNIYAQQPPMQNQAYPNTVNNNRSDLSGGYQPNLPESADISEKR